jgi:hypothetical protein
LLVVIISLRSDCGSLVSVGPGVQRPCVVARDPGDGPPAGDVASSCPTYLLSVPMVRVEIHSPRTHRALERRAGLPPALVPPGTCGRSLRVPTRPPGRAHARGRANQYFSHRLLLYRNGLRIAIVLPRPTRQGPRPRRARLQSAAACATLPTGEPLIRPPGWRPGLQPVEQVPALESLPGPCTNQKYEGAAGQTHSPS